MGAEHPNPRSALLKAIQHLCRAGRAMKSAAARVVTEAVQALLMVPERVEVATVLPIRERLTPVLGERLHPFAAQELRTALSHLDDCIAQARKD